MKILFLLPPSEGKNSDNLYEKESLSFDFNKPYDIGISATQKDLKCSGTRYEEGIELNKNILSGGTIESIKRYTGVMYNAIDYFGMSEDGKKYFDNNFLILSGMYGLVKPQDKIANYKLPIETKGLYDYWLSDIAKKISLLEYDVIVNLLPISYAKLLGLGTKSSKYKENLDIIIQSGKKVVNINFLKDDGNKVSHGVKKIKGEWIKNICENSIDDIKNFSGEIIKLGENFYDINIKVKNKQ